MASSPKQDEIEQVAPRADNAEYDNDLKHEPVLLKSGYDKLGYIATVKRFWKAGLAVHPDVRTRTIKVD